MRRIIAPGVDHCAMMLAVPAATGRNACVGILREREQRRNQRERESREQQNRENASHGIPDSSSVRPASQKRSYMFPLVTQIP